MSRVIQFLLLKKQTITNGNEQSLRTRPVGLSETTVLVQMGKTVNSSRFIFNRFSGRRRCRVVVLSRKALMKNDVFSKHDFE